MYIYISNDVFGLKKMIYNNFFKREKYPLSNSLHVYGLLSSSFEKAFLPLNIIILTQLFYTAIEWKIHITYNNFKTFGQLEVFKKIILINLHLKKKNGLLSHFLFHFLQLFLSGTFLTRITGRCYFLPLFPVKYY